MYIRFIFLHSAQCRHVVTTAQAVESLQHCEPAPVSRYWSLLSGDDGGHQN